jgi:hypothetical protein
VIAADGKPTLKEVGYLAQINEDRLNDPKALREFCGIEHGDTSAVAWWWCISQGYTE